MEELRRNDVSVLQDLHSVAVPPESVFSRPHQRPPPGSGPAFFDWQEVFPELQLFLQEDNFQAMLEEAKSISRWTPWPESHLSLQGNVDWTVFPFLHTFPATDKEKMTFVDMTCEYCPKTVALIKKIPNVRTALFSRLGRGTKLTCHTGWEDLANHVLRCHVSLVVPQKQNCGLWVNGEVQYHKKGNILVFDDSKSHYAFNTDPEEDTKVPLSNEDSVVTENDKESQSDRIVLIIDIMRPSHIPLGDAEGGHTPELDDFISQFR